MQAHTKAYDPRAARRRRLRMTASAAALGALLGCGGGPLGGLDRDDAWTLTVTDGYAREPGPYDWPNPYRCDLRWTGGTLFAACDGATEREVPADVAAPVVTAVVEVRWAGVEPANVADLADGAPVDDVVLVRGGDTYRGTVRSVTNAVYRLRRQLWGAGAACTSDADCRRLACVDGTCGSRCGALDAREGEYEFIARTGCGPLSVAREGSPRWTCLDPRTCGPAAQ